MTSDTGWTPLRRRRSHEHVILEIEGQILAGRLQVGDRLPAERQLAELLRVSRGAVREALRVLEALGVVIAHTGSGADAGSTLVNQPSEGMTTLLRLHLALSGFTVQDMVETRILLEGWAAREAAQRQDVDAWRGLERSLDAADAGQLTAREFVEFDAQFHVGLAKASGNRLISHLMQSLRDTMRDHMERGFEELSDTQGVIPSLRHEHREIYDQIRVGEGERAAARIERHIRTFYSKHILQTPH